MKKHEQNQNAWDSLSHRSLPDGSRAARCKKADLAIVDFKKPHLCPQYNETSHLIYPAKSADVSIVIVNGKVIMENRQVTTIEVGKVIEMAEKAKTSLLQRLASNIK